APALRKAGVLDKDYSPVRMASAKTKDDYRYSEVPAWTIAKDVTLKDGADAIKRINKFQEEYSRKDEKRMFGVVWRNKDREFKDLGRDETGDVWTPMFQKFIKDGLLQKNEPVLTIGPRQAGEIRYFRQRVGLINTIGLDLF